MGHGLQLRIGNSTSCGSRKHKTLFGVVEGIRNGLGRLSGSRQNPDPLHTTSYPRRCSAPRLDGAQALAACWVYERYDPKRKIGEYHTWAAVERAIVRYGDEWLRDGATPKRKKRKRR